MAKHTRKPTDAEILKQVKDRRASYVIRNWLAADFHKVDTPWVLRQLKRLERAGKVRRVPTTYAVMISWAQCDETPPEGAAA